MTLGDNLPASATNPSCPTQHTNKELKRPAQQAGLEGAQNHQLLKRKAPYGGAWTTVAIIERQEEPEEGDEKGGREEKERRDDGDKIQFEEKTMPGGLGREEDGTELKSNLKGFSFKKRTNRERQKMRQRTSDIT